MIKGYSCIYKFTSPSGRVYVGQTVDLYSRYISHSKMYGNSSPVLYKSFKKYGFENHIFEVIEECEISQLSERERYWQEYYDTVKSGLNCKYTSTKDRTGKLSYETRRKIGDAQIGKLNHRYGKSLPKHLNPMYGKKHTEESRRKMSLSGRGKKKSNITKSRMSESKKGGKNPMYGVLPKVARLVLDLETGIYYDSIKEAAFSKSIKETTLRGYLNEKSKYINKTSFIKIK